MSFLGAPHRHAARILLHCRSAFANLAQAPPPMAGGRGLNDLRAKGALCIPPLAGILSCAAADIRPKRKFSRSTDRTASRDTLPPCLQFAHQLLSSGTMPPMLVFARAGFTRPDVDAIPVPRAGAAEDETGAAGFNFPSGVMPRAPFSSRTVWAR